MSLDKLKAERRWTRYDLFPDPKPEKLQHQKKVPFHLVQDKKVYLGWENPNHWSTHDGLDGDHRGLHRQKGERLIWIDFDNAIHEGKLRTAIQNAINLVPSVRVTKSCSGTGIHVIGTTTKEYDLGFELSIKDSWTFHHLDNNFLAYRSDDVVREGDVETSIDPLIEHLLREYGTPEAKEKDNALPEELTSGERNDLLFREACRHRRDGKSELEIFGILHVINQERCNPPVDDQELRTIARSASKFDPASDTFKLTETGDSEFFASMFGDRLRFDHRLERWLLFDGHRWVEQDDAQVDRAMLTAMRMRQQAAVSNESAMKWTAGGEKRSRRDNAIYLARTVKPISDPGSDWDHRPMLLGVANGVIDLETGKLRDGHPEDRITRWSPVTFDESATCPRWERFIIEIFRSNPELGPYTQRCLGYTLTGIVTEQCFWLLFGDGSNGKSTMLETYQGEVMGIRYSWSMPFPTAGWSNSMSEYQRAMLDGKRLITSSEAEHRARLNEGLIKSLTGDDTINARPIYGAPFAFKPVGKFWLRVNLKPVVRDQTRALWRRIKCMPFLESFSVNPDLPRELAAEASGILNWAIRGCLEWQREGLCEPDVVSREVEEYRRESNVLEDFFLEQCEFGETFEVRARDLFDHYCQWCRNRQVSDRDRVGKKDFANLVMRDVRIRVEEFTGGTAQRTGKRGVWYLGVRVLQGDSDAPF